jgi:hypothetical protein
MLIDQVSSFFGRYWHTHYNEIANDRSQDQHNIEYNAVPMQTKVRKKITVMPTVLKYSRKTALLVHNLGLTEMKTILINYL